MPDSDSETVFSYLKGNQPMDVWHKHVVFALREDVSDAVRKAYDDHATALANARPPYRSP